MHMYNIADIQINIASDESLMLKKLKLFSTEELEKEDLNVDIQSCNFIREPQGEVLIDEGIRWMLEFKDSNSTSVYIYNKASNEILAMLQVNSKWQQATVNYIKGNCNSESCVMGAIGEILFRNTVICNRGIVIHSSAIEWEGKGIMFSAPSGTGKTTQANLWKKHMGARILNGDRPAVRVIDGYTYIYGTPWSGSTPEFLNSRAPLKAIIMLEQDSQNSIRKLTSQQAVAYLLPRSFLPYHDKDLMNLAIQNLESIISSTPVYLLKCKPDSEAVELVYQCIK
jgi:hypothetical protein